MIVVIPRIMEDLSYQPIFIHGDALVRMRSNLKGHFRVADITGQSLPTLRGCGVCAFR